ncbi:MAG: phosphatase PAP2 family protein [Lachnospiraceae bacterium]|nr:phosphatase PAP2 family protein [Lachnospiraceae bacterium]
MENIGNIFYFDWEMDLLNWFQSSRNSFLDFWMPKITFLGDAGWFWIALVLLLIAIPVRRKLGLQAALALIINAILCNLILKVFFMRCRPCWLENEINLLIRIPRDFSFPSGHSSASFSAATAIFTRHKRAGIIALILSLCIAVSRMYLFVHWPTDVLFGSLLGIACGIISYIIFKSEAFQKKTADLFHP